MKLAVYDSNNWKDAADAEKNGALYEMGSDYTYDGSIGRGDAEEIVEMCCLAFGHPSWTLQLVFYKEGEGWRKNYDV